MRNSHVLTATTEVSLINVSISSAKYSNYKLYTYIFSFNIYFNISGSDMHAKWKGNMVYLDWHGVFHHPRSDLVYRVAVGSKSGYTDLLYESKTTVTNILFDVADSATSVYIVVKATADNGEFVINAGYRLL